MLCGYFVCVFMYVYRRLDLHSNYSTNPGIYQHSFTHPHPGTSLPGCNRSISTMSSLRNEESCALDMDSAVFTAAVKNSRLDSVDSGVSCSSLVMQSAPPGNGGSLRREFALPSPLPPSNGVSTMEGVYSRLDHSRPSVSSCASCHSATRLLSTSSATDSSHSVTLSSQNSTGDFNDSTTSSGSVFTGPESKKRRFLGKKKSRSRVVDDKTTSRDYLSGVDCDGMIANPSYESHKLKIVSDQDEPPHIYEKVA